MTLPAASAIASGATAPSGVKPVGVSTSVSSATAVSSTRGTIGVGGRCLAEDLARSFAEASRALHIRAESRRPYGLSNHDDLGLLRILDTSGDGVELERFVNEWLGALVEHEIAVVVGPEFLAGSTRLKAGTAQKLVLNTISMVTMIRLGKTYGNLMVDVAAANEKLAARVRRIVATASGASGEMVDEALVSADGDARVAIVSLLAGVDAATARRRLDRSKRSIAGALELSE